MSKVLIGEFSLHRAGADQSGLSNNAYSKIVFTNSDWCDFGTVENGGWTTDRDCSILMSCSVFTKDTVRHDAYGNVTVKFIKYDSLGGYHDIKARVCTPIYTASGNFGTAGVTVQTRLSAGDHLEVWSFTSSINGLNDVAADGNKAHTWWTAMMFGPLV